MAGTASAALRQLEQLPVKERCTKAHQLVRDGTLKTDGITLYASHVVPTILAAGFLTLQSWAEAGAVVQWSRLTEDERRYWCQQTSELLKGSAVPLQSQTFQTFAHTRLPTWSFANSTDDSSGHGSDSGSDSDGCVSSADGADEKRPPKSVPQGSLGIIKKRSVQGIFRYTSIASVLDTLDETPAGALKVAHLRGIADWLSSTGCTLFELCASAFARPLNDKETAAEMAARVAQLWSFTPALEKNFWHEQTTKLKRGLAYGNYSMLSYLQPNSRSKQATIYTKKLAWAITQIHRSAPVAEQSSTVNLVPSSMTSLQVTFPAPILNLLCVSTPLYSDPADVIHKVLQSIETRLLRYREQPLCMRHSGTRVDFDPYARGVTSIAARLHSVIAQSPNIFSVSASCENAHSTFESLLRPLVH